MVKDRPIQHILAKIIGLVVFITIMIILNSHTYDNVMANSIIQFLNDNFLFIIFMSIILLIASIFYALVIPLDLPAPIFSAIGSILLITFIFRIFGLIGTMLQEEIFFSISWIRWILYPIVFIIVLISGYASILFGAIRAPVRKEAPKIVNITPKKHKRWKDVGDEFKNMLYDLFHNMRKGINKKSKR